MPKSQSVLETERGQSLCYWCRRTGLFDKGGGGWEGGISKFQPIDLRDCARPHTVSHLDWGCKHLGEIRPLILCCVLVWNLNSISCQIVWLLRANKIRKRLLSMNACNHVGTPKLHNPAPALSERETQKMRQMSKSTPEEFQSSLLNLQDGQAIPSILVEHLPCARQCSGHWGYNSG